MLVFWARIIKHKGNEVHIGTKVDKGNKEHEKHKRGLRFSFVFESLSVCPS